MKSPFELFSDWSRNKRRKDICKHKTEAVNVMEHNGEIWVCSFGEPVVPLSLIDCGVSDIGAVMERCRNGWLDFKFNSDE